MVTHMFGSIDAFAVHVGDWNEYVERLEQYFIANDIEDDKKKTAIFLTIIGAETYSLLRNLLAPRKLSTQSFTDLVSSSQATSETPYP